MKIIKPLKGSYRISSTFGMRYHPVLKVRKMHDGIDYAAPTGTPVYAAAGGKIVVSKMQGNRKGYGEYIVIDHKNYYTLYAHLSVRSARVGQTVKAGDLIGKVGSTGDSSGPHLHFGVCKNFSATNQGWVDPIPLLEVEDLTKEETLALIKEVLAGEKSKPSDWAKSELAEAKEKGITDGARPGGYATREQVASMILRAVKGGK